MSDIMRIESTDFRSSCDCGRTHEMQTKLVEIGEDALYGFEEALSRANLKGSFCTVYDENTYEALEGKRPRCKKEIILNPKNLHANEFGLELLEEQYADCDFLVAAGAGTVHDLTRYKAYEKKVPFVGVPTAASVDGFTSSVAAMTFKGFKKTVTTGAPVAVVADTSVISKAPAYLTASGFGDVLGKYVSLADWNISRILTGEYYCNYVAELTQAAVDDTCKAAPGIAAGEKAAFGLLTKALVISGIAMQAVGNSRPASGAEHHVSHLIEIGVPWLQPSSALHGEKVGVGTLLVLPRYRSCAGGNPSELISALKSFKEHSPSDFIRIYGEVLAPQIAEENAKNCLFNLTPEALEKNWTQVSEVLGALPDEKTVRDMLLSVGGLTTLEEIGEKDSFKEEILRWSPYVRNRLTFNRLLHILA